MKTIAKIFFGVDSFAEMKKKGISMALVVPAIRWGEWALMGATATLVAIMKSVSFKGYQFSDVGIFLVLWIGNLIICGAVVKFNDSTDVDVTLMEGLRRLVDAAFTKSKIAGVIIEALVLMRLIIWDGASYFIIFFRSRILKKSTKIAAFVVASGFQMAVWTELYILGFDNFRQLWKAIF